MDHPTQQRWQQPALISQRDPFISGMFDKLGSKQVQLTTNPRCPNQLPNHRRRRIVVFHGHKCVPSQPAAHSHEPSGHRVYTRDRTDPDPNCNSIAEQHAEVSQDVANFAGGVLDAVSFGNGEEITSGFGAFDEGISDHVDWESGYTYAGRGVGMAFNLYGAATGGGLFMGLQYGGAAEATAQACWNGWGVDCGSAAVMSGLSIAVPYGVGRGVAGLGMGNAMVGYGRGFGAWLTGAAGLYRDQIAHLCRW